MLLRDTPTSVGLPEIKVAGTVDMHGEDKSSADYKAFVRKHVFGNPYIWWISLANFFVYILRFAVLDWGPTLLKEMKGFSLTNAGWMVGAFEVSGLIGMLLAGWATDRVFGGRGARTCLFCMIGACVAMLLFWQLGSTPPIATVFLALAGFFIYGPQALIGIIAANLATKRAAATAAGFTGLFGYGSTFVSGVGLGYLVQNYGWSFAFGVLLGIGAIGTFMFILAWPAKAHGYQTTPSP
jgi:OPA family glycerol-3-phosphate transporter-like MFS transporter/OPA family sugar phosphate sensor protein UhpC-like MFS transporter